MSLIQLLILPLNRLPDGRSICDAAKAEEMPYKPAQVDLAEHTGFWPLTIGELETGFEYYFEPIIDLDLPSAALTYGTHQMIARTGGSMTEMLASLLFFRTAAKLSDAAYVYTADNIIVPSQEVERYLSEQIVVVRKYIK